MLKLSKKYQGVKTIVTYGLILGLLYPALVDDLAMDSMINGVCIGIFGGAFIALNEIIIDWKKIRTFQFTQLVLYKTFVYTTFFSLLVPTVVTITRSVFMKISLVDFYRDGHLRHFIFEEDYKQIVIFALVGTLVFIFSYQMSRKMGQGVFWAFILGRYHRPKKEAFVLMYIDLSNSTQIAEALGDEQYHIFLNKFFYDITDSIMNNNGSIYRYVGDEITVTWKCDDRFKLDYVVKTYEEAAQAIEKERTYYQKKFGVVPSFTAGVHCGELVIGEIGEMKSQICLLGDALHETALLEKACKQYNVAMLISEELHQAFGPQSSYEYNNVGEVQYDRKRLIPVLALK